MTRSVWVLLDEELVEHISVNQCRSAKEWIFFLIESLNHSQFVKTFVALWSICTARRKAIHVEIYQSPFAIFKFIEKFICDLNFSGAKVRSTMTDRSARSSAPKWIPPPGDQVKINVDAAVAQTKNRGVVAEICRSPDRHYMRASVFACPGISELAILESIVCREALGLANDLQVSKYVIASDCLEVITVLKNNYRPSFSTVLNEIGSLVVSLWRLVLFMKKSVLKIGFRRYINTVTTRYNEKLGPQHNQAQKKNKERKEKTMPTPADRRK
jgi:hypothetical protein